MAAAQSEIRAQGVPIWCGLLCLLLMLPGCGDSGSEPAYAVIAPKSRTARRAYYGAPPVIPHARQSGRCITCHDVTPREIPTLGLAPANPHQATAGMSTDSRCVQCHLFRTTSEQFQETTFVGLGAPPVEIPSQATSPHTAARMPHPLFMHEACTTCHAANDADPRLRCLHTERARCVQCHKPRAEVH
ncbi:MAG: hypothetical protein JSS02_04660 [Planctomycetes bacterium]|nr:hypothetical protein [Planctomycetota bacterium]